MKNIRIRIVGAGAAGCFCAIELKRRLPNAEVIVYEAGPRPLAKLSITGGGRCNLTNSFVNINNLAEAYPRGGIIIKKALSGFSHKDCMAWFEREGVSLIIQEDQCVFPKSQDAMQIVRTLERLMHQIGVKLICNTKISNCQDFLSQGDIVVICIGGSRRTALESLLPKEIDIIDPVPSLFTFKIADNGLKSLMGTVIKGACLKLAGTKYQSVGELLLTDWGISGPASLKLSSYAARYLADNDYKANLLINWLSATESQVRDIIDKFSSANPQKYIVNTNPSVLSERLWAFLISRSGLRKDLRWAEMGSKGRARLINTLIADSYQIEGRARFKEEFVTCGGVDLGGVNSNTLESKKCPGLYFAGEVLDIDAITGGFNLQAAWSTAHTVACAISAASMR